jgi:hypothetical protein
MTLRVRGNERFIRNMPVVGIEPTLYGFNNLRSTLSPYVNEIQFYNPFNGSLGPSIKPNNILDNVTNGFLNNPLYNVAQPQYLQSSLQQSLQFSGNVKTVMYNNRVNVAITGKDDDTTYVKKILDEHFSKNPISTSGSTSVSTSGFTTTFVP